MASVLGRAVFPTTSRISTPRRFICMGISRMIEMGLLLSFLDKSDARTSLTVIPSWRSSIRSTSGMSALSSLHASLIIWSASGSCCIVNPAATRSLLMSVWSLSMTATDIAREVEALLARFPNAAVNSDEHRQLRANIYRPLLPLPKEERSRIVDLIMSAVLR